MAMKPLPAPKVPGKTDFQRFDNAVRKVLSVPKHEAPKPSRRRNNGSPNMPCHGATIVNLPVWSW